MSQVPKYAFRVQVIRRNGPDLHAESHNYENLAGALARREIELTRAGTRKVEVMMVLDESVPSAASYRNGDLAKPASKIVGWHG